MAKIIGIRKSSFKGDHGEDITGVNIYFTEPLEKGEGLSAERVYVTMDKLSKFGYQPKVGDEVSIYYNRYGKCDGMAKRG